MPSTHCVYGLVVMIRSCRDSVTVLTSVCLRLMLYHSPARKHKLCDLNHLLIQDMSQSGTEYTAYKANSDSSMYRTQAPIRAHSKRNSRSTYWNSNSIPNFSWKRSFLVLELVLFPAYNSSSWRLAYSKKNEPYRTRKTLYAFGADMYK